MPKRGEGQVYSPWALDKSLEPKFDSCLAGQRCGRQAGLEAMHLLRLYWAVVRVCQGCCVQKSIPGLAGVLEGEK